MADILLMAGIQETREKIYTALTEAEGLQAWWSQHSDIKPEVGSLATISFYGGMMEFKLRVTELEAGSKVVWAVEGGPPDWNDTTITWTLSDGEGQSMVHFAHAGFASTDGEFAGYNFNWAWYLISLKFYLEKGEGMPHTDADKMPGM